MSVTVEISKEAEAKLKSRADEMGKGLPDFVEYLLEREARDPERSFDEIVAPIHDDFAKSGMTEDELEALLDEVVHEVRAERASRVK
ncbi:MAG: hypothetical protein ABJA02_04300 [Acidobacteriota bacterium]